jgi:TPP-dependent pyruvate/acetoin dehydrogenase alpha subunit
MADMVKSFGIPAQTVDGNDAEAVYKAVYQAVDRARKGDGPSLIEGKIYRVAVHKPGDDDTKYRSREEVEQWKRKDPVARLREKLLAVGILTIEAERQLERAVAEEIRESVSYAESCKDPEPDALFEKLYFGGGRI